MVYIAGEITSLASPDLEPVVRKTINDIGYNTDEYGFNGDTCEFTNLVFEQSPDISQGVTEGEGENLEQGAGVDCEVLNHLRTNQHCAYESPHRARSAR